MALPYSDPNAPDFVQRYVNLADAQLGAQALQASDEFFAAKERMLQPEAAVFIPGKYDTNGKWMDGWETRRKRISGHDWCIVKLARPCQIQGVDLDTSHFTGNYPPSASLEAAYVTQGEPTADSTWVPLLPAVNLGGNRHHYFAIDAKTRVTHLRVNLYPDGGLARLRVYGVPDFNAEETDKDGLIDLASALNGGIIVAANNQHFGLAANLLLPGRGVNMGDGWETRRRREPGNDWCVIALAKPGTIESIEVDTCHFKGNFPDRCGIRGANIKGGTVESLITQAMFWPVLLPEQSLQMNHQHYYRKEIAAHAPVSHVRLDIFPDGGISRLRLRGRPT